MTEDSEPADPVSVARASFDGAPAPCQLYVWSGELWRPTGPEELELVWQTDWRAWPPRLPEQPIFYPVLNEEYAIKIAREWNVPHHGVGYVTRFRVESEFLQRYPIQQAGERRRIPLPVNRTGLQLVSQLTVRNTGKL